MQPASMGADGSWLTELPYTVSTTVYTVHSQWMVRVVPCNSSTSVLQDVSRELAASASAARPVMTVSCPHHCRTPRSPTHPNNNIQWNQRVTRWNSSILQWARNKCTLESV